MTDDKAFLDSLDKGEMLRDLRIYAAQLRIMLDALELIAEKKYGEVEPSEIAALAMAEAHKLIPKEFKNADPKN